MNSHPARYTPAILDKFAELLPDLSLGSVVLDPFAGTGERLQQFAGWRGWHLVQVELEAGWATCLRADATRLPLRDQCVDAAMTSVTYANGLSDKGLRMKNPKGRRTYDLFNGKPLHPNNTGGYGVRQGEAAYWSYIDLHHRAFLELHRVMKPGAPFLLNCSDCYQNGILRTVTADMVRAAVCMGFEEAEWHQIGTPRYRNGANAAVRTDGEYVVELTRSGTSL
jgi:DNA modification methylase